MAAVAPWVAGLAAAGFVRITGRKKLNVSDLRSASRNRVQVHQKETKGKSYAGSPVLRLD